MSVVKKLTMQDFEQQRKQQEEDFKALNLTPVNQDYPIDKKKQPKRPPNIITKKASLEQATLPLATTLPVTN